VVVSLVARLARLELVLLLVAQVAQVLTVKTLFSRVVQTVLRRLAQVVAVAVAVAPHEEVQLVTPRVRLEQMAVLVAQDKLLCGTNVGFIR
jgi:hypothetical protein